MSDDHERDDVEEEPGTDSQVEQRAREAEQVETQILGLADILVRMSNIHPGAFALGTVCGAGTVLALEWAGEEAALLTAWDDLCSVARDRMAMTLTARRHLEAQEAGEGGTGQRVAVQQPGTGTVM